VLANAYIYELGEIESAGRVFLKFNVQVSVRVET
jgi:hypothetical protein